MAKRKIYLDYASTTPIDPRVFAVMKPYFSGKFGNPSSMHSFGQEASEAVEKARSQAADFFGCESGEIIFTSGATESNNLAIKGMIISKISHFSPKKQKPHVITTQFEHSCVLNSCKKLEEQGMAEVTYLPVGKDGLVSVGEVKKNIRPNTALITIMYANNEIGTIQPIKEIGKLVAKENVGREEKILLHTDAVQAVNYLDCNVDNLGVDLLTASAHKIYGPKGIGLLFIRKGTPLKRIQDGGGHEFNLRAGTLNVPGIVGFGTALEIAQQERARNYKIVEKLRDHMFARVMKEIKGAKINGSKIKRIPNNANFIFRDVEGEGMLLGLDMEGVAVSTGSACSSGDLRPSHVLTAIGISEEESHGSLRVTLGKYTTKQEIDFFIDSLEEVVARLRKIAGK
ncbi:MAG TPA: cysteine desulfurase family protein [Candidatus Saccharimonadales bacterium]|nr:cysteine desulfurase family protein [Candidatus Saccharimonadales bacterium]